MSTTQLEPPIIHSSAANIWRRKLVWIVLIAFALRICGVLITHSYRPRTTDQNFGFGWEMGRIAAAIASGEGFSSPFRFHTGPTAWEPPLYPYLAAGVFKLTGIYTHTSAFILLTINSLFSALTCIPVFVIARRIFGERVAKWSVWAWALFPYAMYWAVKWIWETAIAQFLMSVLLLLTLRLVDRDAIADWLGWGALWGVAALLNPALLSVLPFAGLWLAWQRMKNHREWLLRSVCAGLVFAALIAPWTIRNRRVFGQPVFLRTNFGAEFRMGNGPGAQGMWMFWLHPTINPIEFAKYQRMGEVAYAASRKKEAVAWIREHPGQFVRISIARLVYFWAKPPFTQRIMPPENMLFVISSLLAFWGAALAWRQRKFGAGLIAIVMIDYPFVYYLVFPHPRYRAPIEPLICILIAYVLSETKELKQSSL